MSLLILVVLLLPIILLLRRCLCSKAHRTSEKDDGSSCEQSIVSTQALQSHISKSSCHHYCDECERDFADENSLRYHLASKLHQTPTFFCPRCGHGFVSASALVKHSELGSCFNLTNRQIVHRVREWEAKDGLPNLLTAPQIGWKNWDEDCVDSRIYATEASHNGRCYVCPICNRGFLSLLSLNQHLNSNAHEPSEFICRKCGRKFRELSALVAHVESEVCGAKSMSFVMRSLRFMSLTDR